jgi:NAD(P)-dependent dehydrogenase (short-subunit alcohol dehydrogenase family)
MANNNNTPEVPKNWDATQIPTLVGKVAIVTGANSGIGYVESLELARHGAHVIMASRNKEKCEDAATRIRDIIKKDQEENGVNIPVGTVEPMVLDLSSLKSVEDFAQNYLRLHNQLHILLNNAGIMATPFQLTEDKYESQFATNYLGHFALTARLLDVLNHSENARIINLSSVRHVDAKLDLNNLSLPSEKYDKWLAYGNSKLCAILFTKELQRRLSASNSKVIAVVAHPGLTKTNLYGSVANQDSKLQRWMWKSISAFPSILQPPEMGALPPLYAATAPNVRGGEFYGPDGILEYRGYPTIVTALNESNSESLAKGLWEKSEKMANVTFEI